MKYSGIQRRIYNMLVAMPNARERRQKDSFLVKLLTSHWTRTSPPSDAVLVELVRDYNAADRGWRKILEENSELRGKDYGDKTKYAQQAQINLGYESGFQELSTAEFAEDTSR